MALVIVLTMLATFEAHGEEFLLGKLNASPHKQGPEISWSSEQSFVPDRDKSNCPF